MKIDWKHLCTTPGYISLKKAVVENITRRHRNKTETYQMFYTTINRAKHYAYHLNKSLEQVLNEWEEKRLGAKHHEWVIQFYPGHYSDRHRLPKLTKAPNVKSQNPLNYYKKDRWYKNDPVRKKAALLRHIMETQQRQSKRKGKKARWTEHKKDFVKRLWAYKEKEGSKNVI
jgi:hypothetical protein